MYRKGTGFDQNQKNEGFGRGKKGNKFAGNSVNYIQYITKNVDVIDSFMCFMYQNKVLVNILKHPKTFKDIPKKRYHRNTFGADDAPFIRTSLAIN